MPEDFRDLQSPTCVDTIFPLSSRNPGRLRQLIPLLDSLTSKVRSLENKLMRHEYREAQVADFTAKTLNSLVADHSQSKTTQDQMAKQLAAVEERVMATFTLVSTVSSRS